MYCILISLLDGRSTDHCDCKLTQPRSPKGVELRTIVFTRRRLHVIAAARVCK